MEILCSFLAGIFCGNLQTHQQNQHLFVKHQHAAKVVNHIYLTSTWTFISRCQPHLRRSHKYSSQPRDSQLRKRSPPACRVSLIAKGRFLTLSSQRPGRLPVLAAPGKHPVATSTLLQRENPNVLKHNMKPSEFLLKYFTIFLCK